MLKKGSKLYSVLHNKCPRCHEGIFFQYPASLTFKNNLKIYEKCSSCGLKYMIEPSFFYGAMYVSYALTVAMAVAIFVICYLLGLKLIPAFIAIIIVLVITNPFVMRISRLLYINMFVHYQKKGN
ncbi:MAG: DUF983 domain-containing protein [Flavobacteriaceae bacterium]|nr:MAG: DUF983 domain-containing protein [Flavobacteriaceae bacterium]